MAVKVKTSMRTAFGPGGKELINLLNNIFRGNVLFSLAGQIRGWPDFAIDTVEGTDFGRKQVNAQ